MLAQVLGGIGIFLVGMLLATEGLRKAAGNSLHRILLRGTKSPLTAAASGAGITALVQSSSATTVAAIGFVSAGLLTLAQAMGVVFGANIGTTATGWIVALLGIKFSISSIAYPAVALGALMRIAMKNRGASSGEALAGFGMIFVGIDILKDGMSSVSEVLPPEQLPGATLLGMLALIAIGAALTALLQSSSTVMATVLTALHAGTLSIPQAAALVIGSNIGTTITAALAALGGTTAARRAAAGHTLFNVITAVVALILLWPLFGMLEENGNAFADVDPTILIAGFHTVFNVLGVVLILPFINPFTRWVTRLVPEKGPKLTRRLDPAVRSMGIATIEALRETAADITRETLKAVNNVLRERAMTPQAQREVTYAQNALEEVKAYVASLNDYGQFGGAQYHRQVSTMHAIDRVDRLVRIVRKVVPEKKEPDDEIREFQDHLCVCINELMTWLDDRSKTVPECVHEFNDEELAEHRLEFRDRVLDATAQGKMLPREAARRLKAMRRLDTLAFHIWRTIDRLCDNGLPTSESDASAASGGDGGQRVQAPL